MSVLRSGFCNQVKKHCKWDPIVYFDTCCI